MVEYGFIFNMVIYQVSCIYIITIVQLLKRWMDYVRNDIIETGVLYGMTSESKRMEVKWDKSRKITMMMMNDVFLYLLLFQKEKQK